MLAAAESQDDDFFSCEGKEVGVYKMVPDGLIDKTLNYSSLEREQR